MGKARRKAGRPDRDVRRDDGSGGETGRAGADDNSDRLAVRKDCRGSGQIRGDGGCPRAGRWPQMPSRQDLDVRWPKQARQADCGDQSHVGGTPRRRLTSIAICPSRAPVAPPLPPSKGCSAARHNRASLFRHAKDSFSRWFAGWVQLTISSTHGSSTGALHTASGAKESTRRAVSAARGRGTLPRRPRIPSGPAPGVEFHRVRLQEATRRT